MSIYPFFDPIYSHTSINPKIRRERMKNDVRTRFYKVTVDMNRKRKEKKKS